jgi:phosphatidylserine/phosphatidylglycerophosphate/cardiolipin synthase-like enzyme
LPFCTNCGEELGQDSAFCSSCGSQINKLPPTEVIGSARGPFNRIFGADNESVFFDDKVLPEILAIVTNASRGVTFVTPYLGLWVHLKNAMEEAIARGVAISFVVRAGEKKQIQEVKWLRDHKIRVYEVPNLHAKIYFNERQVLVSSMNIYDASTTNSLEFAMLVRNEKDARKLREYVIRMAGRTDSSFRAAISTTGDAQVAFCIRDRTGMGFNMSMPLCDKCYPKWAKYKNRSYTEKYCHSCGKSIETTFARPLCSSCYRKLNQAPL